MSGVKCPDCGLLLSRNDSLNRHMRMHRGDKPYKCEECGWSFTQKGDLIIHQRKHTGEKPFKCPLCSYSAARNACVTKHILVRHPKDDEARLLSASKRERRRAPRANTTGRKRGRLVPVLRCGRAPSCALLAARCISYVTSACRSAATRR
jgi:uncharacterized Zn-finger protein